MSAKSYTRTEIFNNLVKLLIDLLNRSLTKNKISPDLIRMDSDVFTDVGIDSLDSLDLLSAIEDEFQINPDQYAANSKRRIKDIVEYISELLELENRLQNEKCI